MYFWLGLTLVRPDFQEWNGQESNLQPPHLHCGTLPIELPFHKIKFWCEPYTHDSRWHFNHPSHVCLWICHSITVMPVTYTMHFKRNIRAASYADQNFLYLNTCHDSNIQIRKPSDDNPVRLILRKKRDSNPRHRFPCALVQQTSGLSQLTHPSKVRRVRDSNPRTPCGVASFQDWCDQPDSANSPKMTLFITNTIYRSKPVLIGLLLYNEPSSRFCSLEGS